MAASKGAGLIFLVFILSRAIHPMIIDLSKENGKVLYSKNSPAIMSQLMSMLFVNVVAFFEEGMGGVKACWQFTGMTTFGVIGLWYAFGDFLEMLSMGAMSGGVYQILLQSKLIVTAVMMKQIKGTTQTGLQWHVLIAATLAVSAFVMSDSGDSGDAGLPVVGVLMVVGKVAVSCYAAVLSDAKLKGFANLSMSAKLSQMSLARVVASLVLSIVMEPQTFPSYTTCDPFFNHWNLGTWLVTLSFVSKSLITLYLLKMLDSVQKNIGEALSCIVIFLGQVAMGAKAFDLCAFLLAVLVVLMVRIYGLVPKAPAVDIEKGKK